jgi:uncharacterized protein YndB with AHSA1/START domain
MSAARLGDARLALECLQGRPGAATRTAGKRARRRLDAPCAPGRLGQALRGLASAAIDISDGLLGDLGHILQPAMPDTRDTTHPDATFRISRTVDAPLEMVWRAYTEQEPLMAWFGPKGFSMPHSRYDFRPGGEFHYCLRTPTGFEMWGKWVFVDIVAPTTLSMIISFSDAQGGLTRAPHVGRLAFENLFHHDVCRCGRQDPDHHRVGTVPVHCRRNICVPVGPRVHGAGLQRYV